MSYIDADGQEVEWPEEPYEGSLEDWARDNPNETVLHIPGRDDLTDEDFVHLKGTSLKYLNMDSCMGVTDAAFANLEGIRGLDISGLTQITDAAFVHLKGVQTLYMTHCTGITNTGMAHLRNIVILWMPVCKQDGLTADVFDIIGGTLKKLSIHGCTQLNLGRVLSNLRGVDYLDISTCKQASLKDEDFDNLQSVQVLDMINCTQPNLTTNMFKNLGSLNVVYMENCRPKYLGNPFQTTPNIEYLNIRGCPPEIYVALANQPWPALKTVFGGTTIESESVKICEALDTLAAARSDIAIKRGGIICGAAARGMLSSREEVQTLLTVTFVKPTTPLASYEIPDTIADIEHGEISPSAYVLTTGGDCLILKVGNNYLGVKRSFLLQEMEDGTSTFYECAEKFTSTFEFDNIKNTPYLGIRTTSGSFYVPYDDMRNVLLSPWLYWELEKGDKLPFTASRAGVLAGGPIMSADHCQDGTEKFVYGIKPFSFSIEEEEEVVPNIVTLKYGEDKKEIPYDETMTVGAIKDKAKELFSVPDLKLVYSGRILSDNAATVKTSGVQKGFTILVQKVGGKRRTKRGRGKKTYRKV